MRRSLLFGILIGMLVSVSSMDAQLYVGIRTGMSRSEARVIQSDGTRPDSKPLTGFAREGYSAWISAPGSRSSSGPRMDCLV